MENGSLIVGFRGFTWHIHQAMGNGGKRKLRVVPAKAGEGRDP
jgi:hypothetical protein